MFAISRFYFALKFVLDLLFFVIMSAKVFGKFVNGMLQTSLANSLISFTEDILNIYFRREYVKCKIVLLIRNDMNMEASLLCHYVELHFILGNNYKQFFIFYLIINTKM